MKKLILAFCIIISVSITGCFESAEETTINEDGSGIVLATIDMSALIKLAKMAGSDEIKDIDKNSFDTLIKMSDYKDSIENLTEDEKKILDNATMRTIMNPADDKIMMTYTFPYSNMAELITINNVMKKALDKTQETLMDKMMPGGEEGENMMGNLNIGMPDLDDYFILTYENGKLSKKINKEKYTEAANDKTLSSLQELGQMGVPMTIKTIFNLPRAATKAEGKGINMSADKKKITIEATLEDFFDEPSLFEYEIEY